MLLATLAVPLAASADDTPADVSAQLLTRIRVRRAGAAYEEAAGYMELFARTRPEASEVPELLEEAVALRLALGQVVEAARDVDHLTFKFGAAQAPRALRARVALALHTLEHGDPESFGPLYRTFKLLSDRHIPLDAQVRAHAWRARGLRERDIPREAAAELERVRALWADEAAVRAAVAALSGERGGDLRLAAALDAVGESLYQLAEERRREAEAIHLPGHKAFSSVTAARPYVDVDVPRWMQKRRAATDAAERAYLQVLAIQPTPPPRWVLASAMRIGQLWARFGYDLRAPPLPKDFRPNTVDPGYEELRALYRIGFEERAEPLFQRARAIFESCVAYTTLLRHADASSERCVRWLARNDRGGHWELDELRPRWGQLGPSLLPLTAGAVP